MDKCVVVVLLFTCIEFQLMFSSGNDLFRTKAAKIDLLRGYCHGHENAPIQLESIRITRVHAISYILGKLVVKQDNFTQFHVLLKSKRCASKEALDSCEPMPDVTINKICLILFNNNQIWSPFVNSIHPPIECPAKNGMYSIRNGTFDVGPLINFPGAEKWYWKAQVELYNQGTDILAMCLNLDGQIVYV